MAAADTHCIGIDLDNTLVCYDRVFARLAGERGLAAGTAEVKRTLQDAVRRGGSELAWTMLQGEAYGPAMKEAVPFAGAREAIGRWVRRAHRVVVISHKTRFAAAGPPHDLHAHAREWFARWFGDLPVTLYLEPTRGAKLRRIADEGCDLFVDDLLDVLQADRFPKRTGRVWFNGDGAGDAPIGVMAAAGWRDVEALVNRWVDAHSPIGPVGELRPATVDVERVFRSLVRRSLDTGVAGGEPLSGGVNNVTARLRLTDGRMVVGKIYKPGGRDRRERRLRETRFLRLLAEAGVAEVPRVIAVDDVADAALHTVVSGAPWPEEQPVGAPVWTQFSTFFAALRRASHLPAAREIGPAAEAATTLQQHLGFVQERRDRWRQHALARQLSDEVSERVLGELEDAYQDVARETIGHSAFRWTVPTADLVLTPSDFGLHNALVDDDGRVGFVDFEYAGWDDPLKTDIDFAFQPRYRRGRPDCLAALDHCLDRTSARAVCLRELLALKWRYIILAASVGPLPAAPAPFPASASKLRPWTPL